MGDLWKYQCRTFILTFLAYAAYTSARVPYSICKGALHPDPDDPDAGTGYAPFNTDDGAIYLGLLDSTFLGAYTVGLFISGILGDILDLRLFLTMGMLSTSGFLALFGVAGVLQIHVIYWFFACNVLAGLCQSSGWPACVTAMSRWFGHTSRGVAMGVWSSHSQIGNILGKIITTTALHHGGWEAGYIVPACVCALVGLLQLLFLEPNPERVLGREDILELKQITCLPHAALTTENDLVCDDLLELEVGGKSCASGDASEGEMGCRHVDEFRSLNNCSSTDSIGHIDDYKQGDGNRNRHKNINNNRRSGQELSSVLNDKHHPITHACTRIDDQKTQTATSRQMHDTDAKFTERHGGQGAEGEEEGDESENISFMRALLVPGVIPNALCLFFSKLVAYSFIFWLPFYLQRRLGYSTRAAGNFSTVYDMGGVFGSILAGLISDRIGKRATTSFCMNLVTIPLLMMYNTFGSYSEFLNILLMFLVGISVNGPYSLISGAVATDLANHPSLNGNPKAISKITGIIDGTGSLGAMCQGILIAYISGTFGWSSVMYFLMAMTLMSALMLVRLVRREILPDVDRVPVPASQSSSRSNSPYPRFRDRDSCKSLLKTDEASNTHAVL